MITVRMLTLAQGSSLVQVARLIHGAVVLGPAAWGRVPMPEAHMAADAEFQTRIARLDRAKTAGA